MASENPVGDGLDVGRVLAGAGTALRARLADLLIVAVFFLLLPQVLLGFAPGKFPDPEYAIWTLLAALPGLVFDGAASLLLYDALTGGSRSATEAIRGGLLKLSQLFLVSMVDGLAVGLGLILLVAPGLYLAASWLVVTPVLMVEDTNVSEAFRRSNALARGSRWRLLSVVMILVALFALSVVVVSGLLSVVIAASSEDMAMRISLFVIGPILGVALRLLIMSVITSTYVELKRRAGRPVAAAFD
jgi:hypothetical protein